MNAGAASGLALVGGLLSSMTNGASREYQSMDTSRKDVIVRLKWIASVREGEKLDTRSMTVQPMSMMTSVTRALKGLNRAQTLMFLNGTITQAVRIIGEDINHITHASDRPAIERLIVDLDSALKGLVFIKQTYSDDRTFNCALDELTETTAQHLVNFKAMMSAGAV